MKSEHIVYAPFSKWQVRSLNEYQKSGVMHEFTCANAECSGRAGEEVVLCAEVDGLHCPSCDYIQPWAWRGQVDWSWLALYDNLREKGFELGAIERPKICTQCGCCILAPRACGCAQGRTWTATWTASSGQDLHVEFETCDICKGAGYRLCEWCQGAGELSYTSYFDLGGGQPQQMNVTMSCTHCDASGYELACSGGCTVKAAHEKEATNEAAI